MKRVAKAYSKSTWPKLQFNFNCCSCSTFVLWTYWFYTQRALQVR